jgi:hypothetical protein
MLWWCKQTDVLVPPPGWRSLLLCCSITPSHPCHMFFAIHSSSYSSYSPLVRLSFFPHVSQVRHPRLNVFAHILQNFVRCTMRIRWALADITQSRVWDDLGQVLLRHASHGRKLLPQRLPLDKILMHDTRPVDDDMKPFLCRWRGLEWHCQLFVSRRGRWV